MSRRLVVAAALVASFASFAVTEARAQERTLTQDARVSFMPNDLAIVAPPAVATDAAAAPDALVKPVFDANRNKTLLPLYVSTAVMQILDIHSTLQVLNHGGGEGNPMLQGIVGNRPAFIAAKAAVAASTMFAVNRIAKHSRVGAIATSVAINSVYAMVVSHNYKLAREIR